MRLLDFKKTLSILEKYNIPFPATKPVKHKKELKNFVDSNGFPVVLKAFASELLHRTEKELVIANINSLEDLKRGFGEIKDKAPKDSKVLLQKQIKGIELILGMKKDKSFGPAILFGVGGVFVELLNDVSWGIAPLTLSEAKNMINSIKAKKLLKGYRGKEKINIDKIADLLVKISKLSIKEKNIKEIDFNPVIANKDKCLAVDFKFLV